MIDATGLGNKNDPRMRDVEAEMGSVGRTVPV